MTAHTISAAVREHQLRPLCAWLALGALVFWANAVGAQEPLITYQGQLTEAGTPANGDYDFQFALFDNDGGGTQAGETQTLPGVTVSNGLFTVDLNFGISPFDGLNRFLEVSVRPVGGGNFTTLTPRQFIGSTPYAIRSLNAASADLLSSTCTNCVQDTQIQSVAGSKVTGTIPVASVPAGSPHYTQNTTTQQPDSNFNISGDGTVGGTLSGDIVNADTQFNLGGRRVLSSPGIDNLFAGDGAGQATVTGDGTGQATATLLPRGQPTMGTHDSFFGSGAGFSNTLGDSNSFFGSDAGRLNTEGNNNSFFGTEAGLANTTGINNSFFGFGAGQANGTGIANSIFGFRAGANSTGSNNAFFGLGAGVSNFTGTDNTMVGFAANVGSGNLTNATAIGSRAQVTQSNSLVLGSIQNVNSAAANTNVGIGTTAPTKLLHLQGLGSNGLGFGDLLVTGTGTVGAAVTLNSTGAGGRTYSWISTANSADPGGGRLAAFDVTASAYRMVIDSAGNVGIGTTAPTALLAVNGTTAKPGGGSWGTLSDERLKTIKGRFTPGVDAVMQLEPIRYEYKPDNTLGIRASGEYVGFGAHAVQKVIPEAVTTNDQGYLMVNNDPILWTMLNAIKEQQHAIKQQQHAIKVQQHQIEQLKGEVSQLRAATGAGHPSTFQRSTKNDATFSAEEAPKSRTLRTPRLDAVEATVVRSP